MLDAFQAALKSLRDLGCAPPLLAPPPAMQGAPPPDDLLPRSPSD